MPSPTDCSFTKRIPFTPPLVSPSRRHPAGGIENEIFSPVQSNVSRVNSCGGAGCAGVDLHAVAAKTTRARQAGSAAYRQRSSNLIRSCAVMLTFAWTLNPLNVAQRPEDLPRRGPACPGRIRLQTLRSENRPAFFARRKRLRKQAENAALLPKLCGSSSVFNATPENFVCAGGRAGR